MPEYELACEFDIVRRIGWTDDDLGDHFLGSEDRLEVGDGLEDLVVLLDDLVPLETFAVILINNGSIPVKRERMALFPSGQGFPVKLALPEFVAVGAELLAYGTRGDFARGGVG